MNSAQRHGLLIGAGATALALLLWFGHALDGLERTSWDWRVRTLAEPSSHTEDIKLILLDQQSLDWGLEVNALPWPWPRSVYQVMLDYLGMAGAKVVAFDVLFTEDSFMGVEDDEALAAGIAGTGCFVGARFLSVGRGDPAASETTEPIPLVAATAAMLGNVSDVPDPDGVIRRSGVLRTWNDEAVPSLGLASWLVADGHDLPADAAPGAGDLSLGETTLPLADDGTVLLRYRGGFGVYENYNAAEVLQSALRFAEGEDANVPPETFTDSYVLFGYSAPGLLDLRSTPLSPVAPGVVVHATVLDNLLANDFMRDAPSWLVVLGSLVLGLAAALLITAFTRPRHTIAVCVLLLPLPVLAGVAAYGPGWWWPILPGLTAVALALFGGLARNFFTEGRQRRFIKSAFRHYLSPAVIENIMNDPDALKLGGERRELTIMFSDLAGFTALSEGLDPETLTELLNDYLTDMTDIILEEGGTLDKYEGDAILAFWNAPLNQPDHATRACRAAVRCQRKLAERRPEFRERCGHDMTCRIGLHTGEVVVGNMGSAQRFDYTVLGDAANLASRLEGANKAFGSATMISEVTEAQARDAVTTRELGRIQVVGRQETVGVFELIGQAGEALPEPLTRYAEGFAHCRRGELAAALAIFDTLPDDAVAATYAARCREAVAAGEPFTGEWNLRSK